jgi:hypothetical protein
MKRPPKPRLDNPDSALLLILGLAAAIILTLAFVHAVFENVARGERLRAEQHGRAWAALVQPAAPALPAAADTRTAAR